MNIKQLFTRCESEADACYDPMFFSKERVIAYASKASISEDNVNHLIRFIDFTDESIRRFMWQFYYLLFCTEADFTLQPAVVEGLALPETAEQVFPGYIYAVIYLFAVDNLEKWVSDKDVNKKEIIEGYFERYRNMVALNQISHNTYGFCRLSFFLYGYAKPSILRIGRLNFQFLTYKDYCEMYEDDAGNRIFAALPNYTYNQRGLQEENGYVPAYQKEGSILTAHLFNEKGRLQPISQRIDTENLRLMLQPGDKIITIHIPGGGKLYPDEVMASIHAADKLFSRYFQPFKAIVCETWFIDPALRDDVVKDGSNIAAFADLFDIICGTDNNNHSIFEHIFKVKRQPLENLEPQNEFQRRMVERAIAGEKLYWSYGVLKKKYCNELLKERES